jgi:hypothetical protein
MVAPVVLITGGGLLSNGLIQMYLGVNNRMREMTRERLDLLSGPRGDIDRERLTEIDAQLPMMLLRHHRLRDAMLVMYIGIAVVVLSVIAIAVAVTRHSQALGYLALALVLAGTVVMLGAVAMAGWSLAKSADPVSYAVERTRSLGQ